MPEYENISLAKLKEDIANVEMELYQLKRQFKDSIYNIDYGNFSDAFMEDNKHIKTGLNKATADIESIKGAKIGSERIKEGAINSSHIGPNAIKLDNLEVQAGKRLDLWENEAIIDKLDNQNARSLINSSISTNFYEIQQALEAMQWDIDSLEALHGQHGEALYIRIQNGALVIGDVQSPLKAVFEPDKISFINNSNELAYITKKGLSIVQCHTNNINMGDFQFFVDDNGLSLVKHNSI
ncbi:MAG: hypothetical protein GYA87_02820 [Christensenellaceae bacterium]|nr:hypothetical protein [Christensenellaceae bacterium]